MSLLRALQQAGVLRTLDDALAHTLRRLDPSTPDDVLAAAAWPNRGLERPCRFRPSSPRQWSMRYAWPMPIMDAQLAASRFVATRHRRSMKQKPR